MDCVLQEDMWVKTKTNLNQFESLSRQFDISVRVVNLRCFSEGLFRVMLPRAPGVNLAFP